MEEAESSEFKLKTLLEKRFAYFLTPLESFIHKQTSASVLLVAATLFALLVANTPFHYLLEKLSALELGVFLSHYHFSLSLSEWISQGLLTFFFFLTGLEIKREMLVGKLKNKKEIFSIIIAAAGGIIVPALVYHLINVGPPGQHGWGIPTATDTAFTIGVLALMARRVSVGATVFLMALAIFDDIGAIIIISLFYVHEMDIVSLLFSGFGLLLLFLANRSGIRNGWFYAGMGILLWSLISKAGIHPTFSGLLLALAIPARTTLSQPGFIRIIKGLTSKFEFRRDDLSMLESPGKHSIVSDISDTVRAASTPLQRWESSLITPIGIIVLPLFALFNAGLTINSNLISEGLGSSITLGVIAGLVIGKPLGIITFTFLAIKLGWGRLPQGVKNREVIGVALLAGIGFTMSIFFSSLSFLDEPELLKQAKLGVLIASIISACIGTIWIYFMCPDSGKLKLS